MEEEQFTFHLRAKIKPSAQVALDELADDLGINRSEAVRVAINLLLKLKDRIPRKTVQRLL